MPLVLDWMDWYGRGGTASERGKVLGKVMAPIETFVEEMFHPLADGCVAMGDPLLERALSLGIPRDRTLNLLHGCDAEGIRPIDVQEARAALGSLPSDAYVLGHLGVLRRANANLLLQAFGMIRSQLDAPCKLVLIGSHKLGGFAELVPEQCRDDVIETGWLSYQDLNFHLAACDLLLLPFKRAVSTDNIWPSKFNDYLSAGRATVGTRMRVLESVFEKYRIGLLTQDQPQAFADGCLSLLADASLRLQMGRNARDLAEGDLSWENLVVRLETFYQDMIQAVA
jgi:glycosyltransferase involved in cell wall biosynthesis